MVVFKAGSLPVKTTSILFIFITLTGRMSSSCMGKDNTPFFYF